MQLVRFPSTLRQTYRKHDRSRRVNSYERRSSAVCHTIVSHCRSEERRGVDKKNHHSRPNGYLLLYRSVSGARLCSGLNERTKTFRTLFPDHPIGTLHPSARCSACRISAHGLDDFGRVRGGEQEGMARSQGETYGHHLPGPSGLVVLRQFSAVVIPLHRPLVSTHKKGTPKRPFIHFLSSCFRQRSYRPAHRLSASCSRPRNRADGHGRSQSMRLASPNQ